MSWLRKNRIEKEQDTSQVQNLQSSVNHVEMSPTEKMLIELSELDKLVRKEIKNFSPEEINHIRGLLIFNKRLITYLAHHDVKFTNLCTPEQDEVSTEDMTIFMQFLAILAQILGGK
ncbi:MAG: hypothetical protein C4537_04780 [Acholeplasma sp.]|jgi:hypothetical protein|nr:MAG: hypothetical protein C4537_04780 [Acholeplasma sp.]